MLRVLTASALALTLTACGGGGGGSSDSTSTITESAPTTAVNMADTWTFTGSNTVCPGLTAQYLGELADTDGDGIIDRLTRYNGGTLIDLDFCELIATETETIDVTGYALPATATSADTADFVAKFTADYYGIQREYVTTNITTFNDNEISYSAVADDGTNSATENGSLTR